MTIDLIRRLPARLRPSVAGVVFCDLGNRDDWHCPAWFMALVDAWRFDVDGKVTAKQIARGLVQIGADPDWARQRVEDDCNAENVLRKIRNRARKISGEKTS